MSAISDWIERVIGPRAILAEPGFDPTIDPLPLSLFGNRRGGLGAPWVKLALLVAAGVVFVLALPHMRPAAAGAPAASSTASATATSSASPTATSTPAPSASPIPSRTPYGTPYGRPPAAGASPSPVVNFPALTERAIQTLIAAASASPVVIIEHTGGGGCGDCGSADPLPTYTPYPALEPLATYTPLPTYTPYPSPTLEPSATLEPSPTATATAVVILPPGPLMLYRLYLPAVHN